MIKRYILFIVALVTTVAIGVAMKESLKKSFIEEDRSKKLKFSHTFHVKEQGVACEDCHVLAKSSKVSSDNILASHDGCKTCHEEQLNTNCGYCHMDTTNIVPFENPKRELHFSHELHTDKNSIKCDVCHAGMDSVTYASAANMPAMTTCITCHTKQNVSTNCETCHSNFTSLVPEDHIAMDFKKEHKKLTRLGSMEVTCATCHSENFCQDCHTGTELKSFGTYKDLMTEPSPRSFTKDSPKQMRLQQVHALNYRFIHGIDAKSKALQCATCHEQQSFCATCHQAGGNITQQKFKPASHNLAGFTTLGKRSGGGRHAEFAKRNIEECMSCHDVEGQDPTCTMCHNDNGTVR